MCSLLFQDHFTSKKESVDDGSKPKGTRDQYKLNECKPKSEIKSRSKSWYVLEVEKQKSSQIGSVLTVNLFWYFSWKRGQHGS